MFPRRNLHCADLNLLRYEEEKSTLDYKNEGLTLPKIHATYYPSLSIEGLIQ